MLTAFLNVDAANGTLVTDELPANKKPLSADRDSPGGRLYDLPRRLRDKAEKYTARLFFAPANRPEEPMTEPGPDQAVDPDAYDEGDGAAVAAPSHEESGWRYAVQNFTPSWFTVNTATGIVSILLQNLPFGADWVHWLSVAFFALNVALLVAFTLVSVARYALFPEVWGPMVRHPAQSLTLGTFPMGLATVVNMVVFVCVPAWGPWALYLAWGLWWFDMAVSALCCVSLPFLVARTGRLTLASSTAALLLPIVPCVVAAGTGALVADALPDPRHAAVTLAAAYLAWGAGVFFTALVLAMYVLRLHVHSLPPRETIISVFLPVGPFGSGGFAAAKLGRVAHSVLAELDARDALPGLGYATLGAVAYGAGVLVALLMWGVGLMWLAYAVVSIAATRSIPFSMAWWGPLFPVGAYAVCTAELGSALGSAFFDVAAEFLSCCVFLVWVIVATLTLKQALAGELFTVPGPKDVVTEQKRS